METAYIIYLSNGGKALVDWIDYLRLSEYEWRNVDGYAKATIDGKLVSMHRFIMSADKDMLVDHINHNTFDNTRGNLRVATKSQNLANSRKLAQCSSKYKGVRYRKDTRTYQVRIQKDGKTTLVGNFICEIASANAYNHKAIELFGEYAYLNDVPYMSFNEVEEHRIKGRRKKSC